MVQAAILIKNYAAARTFGLLIWLHKIALGTFHGFTATLLSERFWLNSIVSYLTTKITKESRNRSIQRLVSLMTLFLLLFFLLRAHARPVADRNAFLAAFPLLPAVVSFPSFGPIFREVVQVVSGSSIFSGASIDVRIVFALIFGHKFSSFDVQSKDSLLSSYQPPGAFSPDSSCNFNAITSASRCPNFMSSRHAQENAATPSDDARSAASAYRSCGSLPE